MQLPPLKWYQELQVIAQVGYDQYDQLLGFAQQLGSGGCVGGVDHKYIDCDLKAIELYVKASQETQEFDGIKIPREFCISDLEYRQYK